MEEGTQVIETTSERWGRRRRRPRGGVFFPLLLIGLGIILLLNTTGNLDVSIISLLRLWPLLLVMVGLDVLLGGRSVIGNLLLGLLVIGIMAGAVFFVSTLSPAAPAVVNERATFELGEARALDARVDFPFGSLEADALPPRVDEAADVGYSLLPGVRLASKYDVRDERGRLDVEQLGDDFRPRVWGDWDESRMEVALSRDVPVDLNVDTGAGEMALDLTGLEIEKLDVSIGAGDLTVTLPEEGDFVADISVGVGALTLIVPEGLETRIERDGGIAPLSIDASRFERVGDAYVTAGYEEADKRVIVNLDMGVGAVDVR